MEEINNKLAISHGRLDKIGKIYIPNEEFLTHHNYHADKNLSIKARIILMFCIFLLLILWKLAEHFNYFGLLNNL